MGGPETACEIRTRAQGEGNHAHVYKSANSSHKNVPTCTRTTRTRILQITAICSPVARTLKLVIIAHSPKGFQSVAELLRELDYIRQARSRRTGPHRFPPTFIMDSPRSNSITTHAGEQCTMGCSRVANNRDSTPCFVLRSTRS